jgi:hypothetical protein
VSAFNLVVLYLKAIKYINVVPYITTFFWTVRLSWKLLASYAAIFGAVFFGFTFAFHIAFGEQLSIFRTPWYSMVFLSRAFLGDADFSVLYSEAPFLGSLLIMSFILGFSFILMNLFQAIMISALSDAKTKIDAQQAKNAQKMKDQLESFAQAAAHTMNLKVVVQVMLPGLYSRMINKRKKQEQLERKREEVYQYKLRLKNVHEDFDVPNWGRRAKRGVGSIAIRDEGEDADVESEEDLGELWNPDQLERRDIEIEDDPLMLTDVPGTGAAPLTEDSTALVVRATRHIVEGIVERTHSARGVVTQELVESQEVLDSISNILQVLSSRAGDLVSQQQILKGQVL